ncbi:flagellin N-terminal helical domain-containing protein [Pararhizobium qamdonense]|jgi:flagellin-like hook-associated protein FlgL|uniref:flagellin N-terminal helical domain-containing protein n=1 Tax=Pararhizobium qamdonense TaxID=3031126 RepID=UPI0023E1D711|nr:flagellin [Pararhizobium qamdonense]
MTSILTNSSAMAALSTLRSISSDMETTQGRISSGLKVGDASDNAAYWSIATTMKSDNKALSTVQDALGLGAAKTDTAYTGLNAAIDVVSEIKSKLVAAREPGVDKLKINKELTELKNQLVSTATSASFSGENWLYNDTATAVGTKEMVGSFTRDAAGNVAVGVLKFDASTSVLIDTKDASKGQLTKDITVTQPSGASTASATYRLVSTAGASGATGSVIELTASTSDDNIEGMISAVDKMLTNLTDSAATLGATNKRISMQDDFMADLMDVIDKGVGRLVDADMNEESTRLKALQTQQQLGIQALSIANSDSQNILSLFR